MQVCGTLIVAALNVVFGLGGGIGFAVWGSVRTIVFDHLVSAVPR